MFKPTDNSHVQDWRSDGHRWYNNTRIDKPKGNPVVTKNTSILRQNKVSTKNLESRSSLELTVCFILHYIGDEKASIPRSHDNSLIQTKLFFHTRPSVMEKLKQKSQEKEPSRLYKEEIASIEELDTAGEIVLKPRNKKQLENIRSGIKTRAVSVEMLS